MPPRRVVVRTRNPPIGHHALVPIRVELRTARGETTRGARRSWLRRPAMFTEREGRVYRAIGMVSRPSNTQHGWGNPRP